MSTPRQFGILAVLFLNNTTSVFEKLSLIYFYFVPSALCQFGAGSIKTCPLDKIRFLEYSEGSCNLAFMKNIYHKIIEKIALKSRKTALSLFLVIFAFLSFAPAGTCFGYVTPDWDAIARANKRQEVKTESVTVDWAKQKRNNTRQKVKGHQIKINKAKQKKANAKQKVKNKPYKYNRKAEIARNKLQKVK